MTKYIDKKQTMRQRKLAMRQLFLNRTFRVAMIVVVGLFGVMNVVQITKISTKGYEINDLEKQINNLQHETEKLEFDISKYRSIQSIQDRLAGMEMVVVDKPDYVVLTGSAVARR